MTAPTPSGGNFGIDGFIRKAEGLGGFIKTSKFAVEVQGPRGISTETLDVNLYCSQANFPARKFSSGEKKIYGSQQSMPYTATFDETVDLTFFCTAGMQQRDYFEEWQNKIQNPINYNMGYHKDYVGTIFIGVFTDDFSDTPIPSSAKYIIELEEAWPSMLGGVDLNTAKDEFMTFQVQLSYKRWIKKGWSTKFTGGFSRPGGATTGPSDTTTTTSEDYEIDYNS